MLYIEYKRGLFYDDKVLESNYINKIEDIIIPKYINVEVNPFILPKYSCSVCLVINVITYPLNIPPITLSINCKTIVSSGIVEYPSINTVIENTPIKEYTILIFFKYLDNRI